MHRPQVRTAIAMHLWPDTPDDFAGDPALADDDVAAAREDANHLRASSSVAH